MAQLFPASVVGSMPRPQFLLDVLNGRSALDAEAQARAMDHAVAYVVSLQEQAGLDVVTDGEWRRHSYIGVIAELAHGFERGVAPDGRPWTTVTGTLSSSNPGFIAAEAKFVRALTKRQIKITLPAPALLGERLWDPERSAKAYPNRDDFVRDCVPILRKELELIRSAGADIVQIDDPHLCLFVDPDVRARYNDPDRAADFAVEMVNALVEGFPELKFAVHLCRRAGARVRGEHAHSGGYKAILPQLNRLRVQHLTMEFTTPDASDFDILRALNEEFEIGLGCVSVTPGQVDTPEVIAGRVTLALDHIAAERITLNPDCGFAPGSAARVDIDEVYRKLCNEVAAARMLRERR